MNNQETSPRSDIWSFGIMLFEMLAGERPFQGEQNAALITAILTHPTPDLEALRPDSPIALVDLIYRMLQKTPAERIPGARLVGAELEAILRGETVGTPIPRKRRKAADDMTDPLIQPLHVLMTPATVTPTRRHNLPAQTTPFVGRESELQELAELFADPTNRLITILAPGGMGKTRLSLEAAGRHLGHFPEGVYMVELAPLATPESMIPAIGAAIGYVFQQNGRDPRSQILDFLREKHMLLVMDNFEHLLAGATLLNDILEAAPDVVILVTSRERLNLSNEIVFNLGGMDYPDALNLKDALDYSATRLFIQSASRAQPGFKLSKEDILYTARICQLVDGMPLGIVLAASWVEVLTLKEIAAEIERGMGFLETEMRDIPERHRSIRAVLGNSWRLLTEAEQAVFAKMSIFRGGFSRQAAEAVTGASLRVLSALVNKSLLRRNPATGRYSVHELLRQYAEEQLGKNGEGDTVRQKHSHYYLTILRDNELFLQGHEQISALETIEKDFDNIRAAWFYAIAHKDYASLNGAIESLRLFCEMRSRIHERAEFFRHAKEQLAPLPGEEPHPVWCRIVVRVYSFLFHRVEDQAQIEQCLQIARQNNDTTEVAFCLFVLGDIQFVQRNLTGAIELYEQSRAAFGSNRYYLAQLYNRIGLCYGLMSQFDKYADLNKQSYDLARQVGDKISTAWALHSMGTVNVFRGKWQEARSLYEEARPLWRDLKHTEGIATSIGTIALLSTMLGEVDRALQEAQEGFEIATTYNISIPQGIALGVIAFLHALTREDYVASREKAEIGKTILANHPTFPAAFSFILSIIYSGLRDQEGLKSQLREGLNFASRMGAMTTNFLCPAAIWLFYVGKHEKAVELISLAHAHPLTAKGWMEKWVLLQRVRSNLELSLGEEAYQAAWERGKALDIQAVIQDLVSVELV